MPGLMGDNIVGQAGIDRFPLLIEIIELDRLAVPVIVCIPGFSRVGNQDNAIALESPGRGTPQDPGLLVHIQDALDNRPDIDLVELGQIAVLFVYPNDIIFIFGKEAFAFRIPLHWILQLVGIAIVIDDRDSGAGGTAH